MIKFIGICQIDINFPYLLGCPIIQYPMQIDKKVPNSQPEPISIKSDSENIVNHDETNINENINLQSDTISEVYPNISCIIKFYSKCILAYYYNISGEKTDDFPFL